MIPILYSSGETSFTTEGVARLVNTISCKVVEERNGKYELTMVHPADDPAFLEMSAGMIILAKPSELASPQPFRIYKITTPLNGKATVYAQHISYDLTGIPVKPFTATGISVALNKLRTESLITNSFTFVTDIVNTTTQFKVAVPTSVRACLGGTQGSILDMFGGSSTGEFEWDRFLVKFLSHRGNDNGVVVRYGKNMTDLNKENSNETVYTGVLAYWADTETNTVVRGNIKYVSGHTSYPAERIYILDATQDFEDQPTVAQLNTRANQYIDRNNVGIPKVNVKVSFVPLWEASGYEDLAPLERVSLCDTVTVYYEEYGVNATAKVIATDYDVLTERYNSITLGDAKSKMGETIQQAVDKTVVKKAEETTSFLESVIQKSTDTLAGGNGGYVVLSRDGNGYPYEILIMDHPDKQLATNVIRMNQNGIGFSTTGYSGQYTTAWTIDGVFNADYLYGKIIHGIEVHGSELYFGTDEDPTILGSQNVTVSYTDPQGGAVTKTVSTPTISGKSLANLIDTFYLSRVSALYGDTPVTPGITYTTEIEQDAYGVSIEAKDNATSDSQYIKMRRDAAGAIQLHSNMLMMDADFVYNQSGGFMGYAGSMSLIDDFNTATTQGQYRYNPNTQHLPTSSFGSYGICLVYNGKGGTYDGSTEASGWLFQIAWSTSNNFAIRTRTQGGWTPWRYWQ